MLWCAGGVAMATLTLSLQVFKKPLEEKELIDSRENAVLFGCVLRGRC